MLLELTTVVVGDHRKRRFSIFSAEKSRKFWVAGRKRKNITPIGGGGGGGAPSSDWGVNIRRLVGEMLPPMV